MTRKNAACCRAGFFTNFLQSVFGFAAEGMRRVRRGQLLGEDVFWPFFIRR